MISSKIINFRLGAMVGAGLVLVVRVIVEIVVLIAMEITR